MTDADKGSIGTFGLDDAALAEHPTIYAPPTRYSGTGGLVSGGAGGIGRAIAWLLARLGAHVVISGRSEGKLDGARRGDERRWPGGVAGSPSISANPSSRSRLCMTKVWTRARPLRHPRQQRRRPVPASGDRFLGQGLERRHQHQSQRHLAHDAGGGAALARREACRAASSISSS